MVDLAELASWTRAELVEKARQLGVERPERMTRIELRDEIQRLSGPRTAPEAPRGLFGTARSMLASMVEAGLNMPEAAAVIRGEAGFDVRVKTQPPVATVTLAEIYAAQGHRRRAIRMLEDVLAAEPDHEVARELKRRLEEELEQKGSDTAPGATSSRDPEWVETTGEEVRTGRPPEVIPHDASPTSEERVDLDDSIEHTDERTEGPDELTEHTDELTEGPDELIEDIEDTVPEGESLPEEATGDEGAAAADSTPEDVLLETPAAVSEAAQEPDLGSPGETSEVVPQAHAALPLRPETDALFYRRDADGTRIYWELAPPSTDRAQRRMPEGKPVVRVVGVPPTTSANGGPTRIQFDFDVTGVSGVIHVAELHGPQVVRAALGWLAPEGFVPFAVGADLDGSYQPPAGETGTAARIRALHRFDDDGSESR
jgi:hypothetical protein